ncbi:uncharacterized protein LOC125192177 [Salvia hispanica]|uniref:uncharacterized protein LOC125192177 n=1 Tax=Salvia hispanica TaxID=49212 RepID=UPI0020095C90|nr:uncharacterized protein LOC125192177 [Salvia hispanica]
MERKNEDKLNLEVVVESSPYTQFKDIEDYKQQAYGAQGHQQPKPGRGAASSTDAPTLAGAAATDPQAQLSTNPTDRKSA